MTGGNGKPEPLSVEEIAANLGMPVEVVQQMIGMGAPSAGADEGPASGADLATIVAQSAKAVPAYNPALAGLPLWAQGLGADVLGNADFNPYLGVLSEKGDERVYWGNGTRNMTVDPDPRNKFSTELGDEDATTVKPVEGDKTLTAGRVANMPYTWDDAEVADAMKKMKEAGLQVDTFDDLLNAWGGLVNRAVMTYALTDGKRKVTPWDVLDLYKQEAGDAADDPSSATFTGNKTQVNRTVTEIDEGQAWASIQGTLSSMLGRDPSDQETRDFTYRMGQLAARNPAISKTVTSYKDGTVTGSTEHRDPGFTTADMAHEAYDNALDDPEHAEYQSASTYFNALQSALGPIGG